MTALALLLVLILINGVFSMSEIALVSSRRARLQQLADADHPGARRALQLSAAPTRFLSTVQMGITSIGILSGAVGESAIALRVQAWLQTVPALEPWAQPLSLVIMVVRLTYVSLILGELVPKRAGTHVARAHCVPRGQADVGAGDDRPPAGLPALGVDRPRAHTAACGSHGAADDQRRGDQAADGAGRAGGHLRTRRAGHRRQRAPSRRPPSSRPSSRLAPTWSSSICSGRGPTTRRRSRPTRTRCCRCVAAVSTKWSAWCGRQPSSACCSSGDGGGPGGAGHAGAVRASHGDADGGAATVPADARADCVRRRRVRRRERARAASPT